MIQMDSGVHFSLMHTKVLGTPEWPLSAVPFQDIVRKIEEGKWDAKLAFVFKYEDIVEAHKALSGQKAGGKIVVKHY
jgi:NADPH:quinone reductase